MKAWIFKRVERPDIPPPPDPQVDPEATARMEQLLRVRARRGDRLTRDTKHAIAQNHFALNMKKAFEPKPPEGQ